MRQVAFEKAVKYASKDVVIKSDLLKSICSNKKQKGRRWLQVIADEVPMSMKKIKDTIIQYTSEITYIEIMSNAKFYVLEYNDDEYGDDDE